MKKSAITFGDFQKLDIRVGEIKTAEPVEGSTKLLFLQVDLGEDYGVVEIFSGIAKFYKPEELVGKKFPFLANLEPKQMMGKTSTGMIMAVDVDSKPVLLPVDSSIPPGEVVR